MELNELSELIKSSKMKESEQTIILKLIDMKVGNEIKKLEYKINIILITLGIFGTITSVLAGIGAFR